MKPYSKLTKEELKKLKGQLEKQFEEVKAKGIHLDMSRGKPSKAQLDLSNGLMDVLNGDSDLVSSDGVDCRNYGVLDGITEARKITGRYVRSTREKYSDLRKLQPECNVRYSIKSYDSWYHGKHTMVQIR